MIDAAVRYVDYIDEPPTVAVGPFMVAAQVGIGDENGCHIFQVVICTASWIAQQADTASAF
jgi:hypothetical protein